MSPPLIIWLYWFQGEQNLPFLVRQCVQSWRVKNPEWEVRLLDRDSLKTWVDLDGLDQRSDIGLQALTDIIRVKLLTTHGGVWADASLFCARPLDSWLSGVINDDFFAFASKRQDRWMTTWFLAGTGESSTLKAWTAAILDYWQHHTFRPAGYWTRQVMRKLMSLRKRGRLSNDVWFSSFVLDWLKTYPYPVNMYLFERAIAADAALSSAWQRREQLYDYDAEYLQNTLGMNAPLSDASRRFLDENPTPVHKLNWRQDQGRAPAGSNFAYLIEKHLG